MATTPPFVRTLEQALVKDLRALGLSARAYSEPVPGTKMFRFMVISAGFSAMRISERHAVVTRIMDRALTPEDAMKVSMILTLTPAEHRGDDIDAAPPSREFAGVGLGKPKRRPQARRTTTSRRQAAGHR